MKRRRFTIFLGVVLILVGILWYTQKRPTTVTTIASGEINQRIIVRAVVAPSDGVARIFALEGGTIKNVKVRTGDRVKQGDVLATFEHDVPVVRFDNKRETKRETKEITASVG